MFIRYNETNKYYEYDTSPGQTGAGPWIILPIDYDQIYNPPTIANSFNYRFDIPTAPPPAAQRIIFDAPHPYTGVTKVYASDFANNGANVKNLLMRIAVGSRLYIQQTDNNNNWGDFTLASAQIDGGTYVEFPVTQIGTGNAIANNSITSLLTMSESAPLPANVALLDRVNQVFTEDQVIRKSTPRIFLQDPSVPVDKTEWNIQAFDGELYFQSRGNVGQDPINSVKVQRNGSVFFENSLTTKAIAISDAIYERGRGNPLGNWSNYTPTIYADSGTNQPSGYSLTGAYTLIGNTCHFRVTYTGGANPGAGAYFFTLPIPSSSPSVAMGPVQILDIGTSAHLGVSVLVDSTRFLVGYGGPYTWVGAQTPFTWVSGDMMNICGTYALA